MKKSMLIAAITVSMFLFSGCLSGVEKSDRSVYSKRFAFSQKMADTQGYIKVECMRSAKPRNDSDELNFAYNKREGVGFWVGPDLFMTAAHVGVFAEKELVYFFGLAGFAYFVNKDVKYEVDGMEAELLEVNRDAALYRVKGANKPYFKFAKNLKQHQEVLNVGNAFLQGKGIHYGTISVPETIANDHLAFHGQYDIKTGDETGFLQAIMTVTFGCSGSALFVNEDGEIKYAGMVNMIVQSCITIGHNARFLSEMLERNTK